MTVAIGDRVDRSTGVSVRRDSLNWPQGDGLKRVADWLVGEEDQAVTDGAGVDEAHVFRAAGLAEESFASTEHERVDHQPQLVDEVVLYQRVHELKAGIDDDVPVNLSAQRRDLIYDVAC